MARQGKNRWRRKNGSEGTADRPDRRGKATRESGSEMGTEVGTKRKASENDQGEPKKRQRVKKARRSHGPELQHSNVAAGVGIYTGFTMFEPKPKKKEAPSKKEVPSTTEISRVAASAVPRPITYLDKMRARLSGGQFRMLNQTLYGCRGEDAYELFKKDPAAFTLYHSGYQEQMSRWPVLPVDVIIKWLKSRSSKLIVADFGCGDARLAKSVCNKVFSLDLVSTDPDVISCNMAHTPLHTSSVDVAIFCLSLMGTDYPSFIEEASRVLKPSGMLLIAEVKSRFDPENGGASPQLFITALESFGFSLKLQDSSNKMFIMLQFQKHKGVKDVLKQNRQWPVLKACVYKRR